MSNTDATLVCWVGRLIFEMGNGRPGCCDPSGNIFVDNDGGDLVFECIVSWFSTVMLMGFSTLPIAIESIGCYTHTHIYIYIYIYI